MKMKQVYEENPALGDPMSIQGQLTENEIRLEKIRSELKKYQVRFGFNNYSANELYFGNIIISLLDSTAFLINYEEIIRKFVTSLSFRIC